MNRIGFLGGSDATILMSGDAAAIHDLWLVKTGKKQPDDLSRVLPVQMGLATEALNLRWHELTTGRAVTHAQDARVHPSLPWMTCTLDGMTMTDDGQPAVFEAKHVNAFSKIEEVGQRYMAQLHHNMMVVGVEWAVLSVFVGTLIYERCEVPFTAWYANELIEREKSFWACVEFDTPPGDLPAIAAPVPPDKWLTVDMTGNNTWGSHAADWIETRAAAKTFEAAQKGIKGLIEPHVGKAHGHGIIVTRSKAGALTIKEGSA